MKRISYLDGVATGPTGDTEIEIIENKLLDLAIEGDEGAASQYTDLYLSRLNWEGTQSAEHRREFVDQAQDAQTWLVSSRTLLRLC